MTTALAPSRSLSFQDTDVSIYDDEGRSWVTGADVARCLYDVKGGCQNVTPLAVTAATKRLYAKHADEFDDRMTRSMLVLTEGGPQQVRVFSLRGAHLLGMLSNTKKAKAFRSWILDLLESRVSPPPFGDPMAALTPKERGLLESVSSWTEKNITWGERPPHRDNSALIFCGYVFREGSSAFNRKNCTNQEFDRVFLLLARHAAARDGKHEDAYVEFSRSGRLVGWVCVKRSDLLSLPH